MKSVKGITFTIFSFKPGLWWDDELPEREEMRAGIRFHFVAGKMIRPISRFWKGENAWQGDSAWFVLRCPMAGFFFSFCWRGWGFYFGFKTFGVSGSNRMKQRYGKWMRPNEFGTDEGEARYLTPSISFRRSRLK